MLEDAVQPDAVAVRLRWALAARLSQMDVPWEARSPFYEYLTPQIVPPLRANC